MKKIELFFLLLYLPLFASAVTIEVDGIYFNLITKGKIAEVVPKAEGYKGDIIIPPTVLYNNDSYEVTSIKNAFTGCNGLISVTIPNSINSIDSNVFGGCSGLTSVTIPNSITYIGLNAFYGCDGLISITIPNSVTVIDCTAFSGCKGLTSVTFGEGIERIESGAFNNCPEIEDVYCLAEKVPMASAATFENCYIEFTTLHVPAVSLENYKNTEPWSNFKEIVPIDDSEIPETSISKTVLEERQDVQVFDIYGRRLSKLSKGVNIFDGKKVLIK